MNTLIGTVQISKNFRVLEITSILYNEILITKKSAYNCRFAFNYEIMAFLILTVVEKMLKLFR